jgi:serine phosphatase RsbU (regulator of sigma subunit)
MEESNISSGDIILLYTDGVTEAKDKNNEQYSMLRLEELFSEIVHQGVESI